MTNIAIKDRKINELDKNLKDLQSEYDERLGKEIKEKQVLLSKNERDHKELNELKEKYD